MPLIRNQKLDAIRQAAIAVNPSIKKLEFGCKVLMEDPEEVWRVYLPTGGDSVGIVFGGERRFPTKSQITKIIGRDLTLADVLKALDAKHGNIFSVNCEGHLLLLRESTETGLDTFEGNGIYWDLTKTLDEQPDATLDFIHELLKK